MKKLAMGCNRISAVEVLKDPPLCVCCVYMPSRNSKTNSPDQESYQLCIDQLEEIINTFSGTHALVIVGDMNASLRRRNGNNQDVILENFVKSNGLFCEQTGTEPFFHPNQTDRAEIDYMLLNDKSKSIVRNVAVDNGQTLNTTDHVPVIGTFKIHTKKTVNQTTKVMCKQKWDC